MNMTAPASPALSEASIRYCCSDPVEGSNANSEDSDYSSPEVKRTKRFESAQVSPTLGGTTKRIFRNFIDVRGSESHSSLRTVCDRKCCFGMERDSSHSLPTLDFKGLSGSESARICRRSSLDENVLIDSVGAGGTGVKNDKRALIVLSSYHSHHKENQQLARSDRGSLKARPIQAEESDPSNAAVFGRRFVTEAKITGLSEATFESGEDHLCRILMQAAPLETLMSSRENYENWSTSNSLPEDDGSQRWPKSSEVVSETNETTQRDQSPVTVAGDTETWSSHIEKRFKTELEFSTLLTLAYVRVRDLTKSIDQANQCLMTIDEKEQEEEASQLLLEIESMFKARSELRREHHKWCSNFNRHYEQRKKVLSTLKSQAASAERTYFKLRKELEDLQNEPIVRKPKRSWFSRLCAFVK